jgi:TolB-like protein
MSTAQAVGLWLVCGLAAGLAQTRQANSDDATSAEQMRLFALTTPLRAAVTAGDTERVAELLDAHREWATSRDFEGNTLLHRAAAAGHQPMITLLLARGVDPGVHNARHELALEAAEDNGHTALARQLRETLATRHQRELDRRLSVLVLPFQSRSADPEDAHWSHALDRLLSGALEECARLRLRGDSAVRLGLRATGLEAGQSVSLEQAVQVGRRVEVRCVVWGSFGSTNGGWQVTARMANVARGLEYHPATVAATDWYDN